MKARNDEATQKALDLSARVGTSSGVGKFGFVIGETPRSLSISEVTPSCVAACRGI